MHVAERDNYYFFRKNGIFYYFFIFYLRISKKSSNFAVDLLHYAHWRKQETLNKNKHTTLTDMHTMRQRYIVASLWFLLFFFVGEVSAEYAPSVRQNQDRVSSNTQSLLFQSQQIMSPVSSYEGRVYSPFSNSTPADYSPSSPSHHKGNLRKETSSGGRTPGEATTGSNQSPVGEPWVMLFMALALSGFIALKQYYKQTTATETNNTMKPLNKGLFALAALLTLGVGNAWGLDASNARVYFDNTKSNWSNYVQLVVGHNNDNGANPWSVGHAMSKITNTNNLWTCEFSFGGYSYFMFINASGSWEGAKQQPWDRKGTYAYTSTRNTNLGSDTYLYMPNAGNDAGFTISEKQDNGYSDLNYTQTIEQKLYNGSSYELSTATLASTIKVSSYYLSDATTASSTGDKAITSGNSSTSCSAARTATVTYTISGVQTGYEFIGWYEGETQKGTSLTYSYAAQEAKTVTARFAPTYTVNIAAGVHGTVNVTGGTNTTGNQTIGQNSITIAASDPENGFYFAGWQTTGGAHVADANAASTTIRATANGSVTANFAPRFAIIGSAEDDTYGTAVNGMPGWSDYTYTLDYVAANDFERTLTLKGNTTYKFRLRDLKEEKNLGYANEGTITLNANSDCWLNEYKKDVKFTLNGSEVVKFKTRGFGGDHVNLQVNTSDDATTSYTATYSSQSFYVNGTNATSTNGGTVSAVDWKDYSLASGGKVKAGTSVVFTATPATGYTFEGWYSDAACTDGNKYTTTTGVAIDDAAKTLTLSSINANKTVYAKFVEKMATVTIAANDPSKGTVTVGGASHTWGSSVNVGVTTTQSLSVTAAAGYYFAGWERTGTLDFNVDDASAATSDAAKVTTLRGLGATDGTEGTLTARFEELDKIYFRNENATNPANKLWGADGNNVYVYFDAYWDSGSKGAGGNGKPSAQMEEIGSSHIYWAYVPRSVTYAGYATVAFSSRDWRSSPNFDGGGYGAYRSDYNRILNMFVPHHDQTNNLYTVSYNNNGYWMKYDTKAGEGAGYYWQRYTSSPSQKYTQVAEMVATTDNATTLKFTVTIDDITGVNNHYMITSAGGLKYWPKTAGGAVETITSSNCTNLNLFEDKGAWPAFVFQPTIKGDYTFTLDQTGDVMKFSVEYPETPTNGYRLKCTYDDGSAKTTYSNIISATDAASGANTVSMFLSNEGTGTLVLQKCTGIDGSGNLEWSTGYSDNLSSALAAGATPGVYVFDITINTSTDKVTTATTPSAYTGDYYIHVNATTRNNLNNGDPKAGSAVGNKFTKFLTNATFGDTYNHYWVDWFIGTSDGGGAQVVAATIGNGINDDLAGKVGAGVSTTTDGANVRYGYNSLTNEFSYAMIEGDGASIKIEGEKSGRVLIKVNGDYVESNGTPRSAVDADNWMYKFEAKVKMGSRATITTSYNSREVTLAENKKILGAAEEETQYTVEVTYDFKTNRLIAAWIPNPEEEINKAIDLYSNLMVVRSEDGDPTLLNLVGAGDLDQITQIYTVMEFSKANWDASDRTIIGGGYTDAYYWFSLPYDCNVSDIFGIEGYGSDGYWVIQTYHGDYRAQQGWWAETDNWWYDLERSDKLNANQGYVLRLTNLESTGAPFTRTGVNTLRLYFPSSNSENIHIGLLGASASYKLGAQLCNKVRDEANHAGDPNYDRRAIDSNWRVIGSPSFNKTEITTTGWSESAYGSSGIAATPLQFFYTWAVVKNAPVYTITSATDYEFPATHAYLVQYAGDITWDAVTSNPLVGIKAPRRTNEDTPSRMLQLVLNKDGEQADVTYISRMEEGATEGYDLNLDLSKILSASGNNLYTIAGYYKMAGNCLPDTVKNVPVGVQIADEGEYTFALPEGTNGVGVVLVDKVANTRTNLALTDYTVNLTAGEINDRFSLELSPVSNVPTGIDNSQFTIDNSQCVVRKVLIDGVLYIVKDGKIYDARGRKIQD